MRFRSHLFALAMLTAVAGGAVKAVLLGDPTLTGSAALRVIMGVAAATAITYSADAVGQRLWAPTRDTVRAVVARKEALAAAVTMSSMMAVYGWTDNALSGQPVYWSLLWVDGLFLALGAGLMYALYRHLSTR